MKKYSEIKCLFLYVCILSITSGICDASDNIPLPPKRPDILNVSPAYIEELLNRGQYQATNDKADSSPLASIYIPKSKPTSNNIESTDNNKPATTLISFSLQPEQITLDNNLEFFLKKHAIKLFSENTNLKMEIHAYATPIKGEPHSDVRISLARALKVRSFLINNKIEPHRLKLSPMGNDKMQNSNNNRIDLLFY